MNMRMGNGTGSIVKLSGNRRKPYAVRVTTGWEDGKQKRKYLSYHAEYTEALGALLQFNNQGIVEDLSGMTLQEVFDKWIVRVEAKGLSPTVVTGHRMAQKRFGLLGNTPMRKIKTDHLQDWLNGLDLKPASKGKVKQTLSQMYDYAFTNDIVEKNYAKALEVTEKVEKTGSIFTTEQLEKLWEYSDERDVQDILILTYTGMRIGELVKMTRTNVFLDSHYMIGGSKTEAGKNRVIPIHNAILPFIERKLRDSKYIMHTKAGDAITYSAAARRFEAVMKRFGWNHKLHDTRKTGISLMHSAGIPMETVRIIAGHSGKGITEKVYLYKEPTELVEAINKIEIPWL